MPGTAELLIAARQDVTSAWCRLLGPTRGAPGFRSVNVGATSDEDFLLRAAEPDSASASDSHSGAMGDKRNGKNGNDKSKGDREKPSAKRKKKGRKQGLDKWEPRQQRG